MEYITTKQLSEMIGRSEGTIRNNLSKKGSFWDVVPLKNPAGGLYWPKEPFVKFALIGIPKPSVNRKKEVNHQPFEEWHREITQWIDSND